MNTDQTSPEEKSSLGPYRLQCRLAQYIYIRKGSWHSSLIAGKMLKLKSLEIKLF